MSTAIEEHLADCPVIASMVRNATFNALLERRAFSWLPRAQADRRQIETMAFKMRRISQRRKP